jgi:hypothetical protein
MSSTVPAHKRTTLGAAVLKAADNRISVPHNTVSAAAQSTFTEVPGNETAARGQISSFFDQVRATYSSVAKPLPHQEIAAARLLME